MFSLRNKEQYLFEYHSYREVEYRIYRMYSGRKAWANSVDPDETPHSAASHQGQHCLPLIQQFLDKTSVSKLYLFIIKQVG